MGKKKWGAKIFWDTNTFGSKMGLVKNILSPKKFGSTKIFDQQIYVSKRTLCPKMFWVQKVFRHRRFSVQINWVKNTLGKKI